MRKVGGYAFAALLIFLFLLAAFFYGANWYLRDGGEKIGEIIRRYAPGAEVRFSRAGLRPGPGTAAFFAEDLFIDDGRGGHIAAPRADFWLGADGVAAVLHSPEITLRGGAGGAAPLVGEWAAEARGAKVYWLDPGGVSLTLHNALLRARYANGRLRADVLESHDGRELNVKADLHIGENGIRGAAEAALKNWPPEMFPPQSEDIRATIRAAIDEDGAQLSAAGDRGAILQWRANGRWDGAAAILTVDAAAAKWTLFAEAPPLDAHLRGELQYRGGGWEWRGDFVAAGEDGKAGGEVFARGAKATIAETDADLRMTDIPAASLWKYVPHAKTRAWLADSVAAGVITAARMRARGAPSQPSINLTAAFADGRIRIAEGWPDARHLNGILTARGGEIVVGGEGEIGGATADSVRAHIPATDAETPATLYLRAAFSRASVQTYLEAARALPPAREKVESVLRRLSFSGDARLSAKIAVPLAAAENSEFSAQLTILGNGGIAAAELPPLSAISGIAEIDGDGIRAALRGNFADATVTVFAENENLRVRGKIAAATALSLAGVASFPASGAAEFALRRDARQTVFSSDLRGISFGLPPPLEKAAAETASLRAEADGSGARASLRLRGNDFRLAQNSGGGTDIAINESSLPPPAAGAYIHGAARGIREAAKWLAHGGGSGGGEIALSLALADAEILNMAKQNLTVRAPPPSENGARQIALRGDAVAGTIFYRPGAARAELSRLHLAALPGGDAAPDIRGLSLAAAADDFRVGDVALGALTLRGAPEGSEWALHTLRVESGGNILGAGGRYDGARTALTLQLAAADAPAALAAFGQDNVISEGGATLAGGISWDGAPPDFSLDAAEGRFSLLAEDLRYLKSETGVIGFLAVFSPQSLLQLGFTELGKEGLQIEEMRGEIALQNGVAEFRDFVMENDDLNISLRGETDLRAQTLDLSGRVRPGHRLLKAGSVVGIGAVAAVQPISLAAGWFLGKIFEKPLSEIGAYDYAVTGVWKNPIYSEKGATFKTPANGNGAAR